MNTLLSSFFRKNIYIFFSINFPHGFFSTLLLPLQHWVPVASKSSEEKHLTIIPAQIPDAIIAKSFRGQQQKESCWQSLTQQQQCREPPGQSVGKSVERLCGKSMKPSVQHELLLRHRPRSVCRYFSNILLSNKLCNYTVLHMIAVDFSVCQGF